MRVYLTPPQPSRGLDRIAHALRRYAPASIEVCESPRNVDLTVIYAIGRRDHVQRQVNDILSRGKQYAIIQCCLRSTMSPKTQDWLDIWQYAAVVWSYYDLEQAVDDDYGIQRTLMPNFYHAPLGAGAAIFYPRDIPKQYVIATSGRNRLQESIRECALAAAEVDGLTFHLGPKMKHANIVSVTDIDDLQLATRYSMCHFVSGLRRTEGFELPAVEGLLCGARPILFNSRDYRIWYEPWGIFIEEGTRQQVVNQLVEIFKQGAEPVTTDERNAAVERFNWKMIIEGFWERFL